MAKISEYHSVEENEKPFATAFITKIISVVHAAIYPRASGGTGRAANDLAMTALNLRWHQLLVFWRHL